jgi:hypothetical protein
VNFSLALPIFTLTRDFLTTIMSIQTQEARIILAIKAIRSSKRLSCAKATKIYNILYFTFTDKINGRTPRQEYRPLMQKLTELEEEVILRNILELDIRGFAPRLASIKDMANYILELQGGKRVGKL